MVISGINLLTNAIMEALHITGNLLVVLILLVHVLKS